MEQGASIYLVDDPSREHQALRILVEHLPWLAGEVFASVGLNSRFSWFLLRLQHRRVHPRLAGDIDLLAGPLEWRDPDEFRSRFESERNAKCGWHPDQVCFVTALTMAYEGHIQWPPSLNHLVAIEAKCAYLDPEASEISAGSLKSMKTGKVHKTRRQVDTLLRMGFDRVSLLDIIANPPAWGSGFDAWLRAGSIADQSRRAMLLHLRERLPDESPAGHWVWSAGAVLGKTERYAGAGQPLELRPAVQNPMLETRDGQISRMKLNANLREELEKLPAPRNLQVVFDDCPQCGTIHPAPFCDISAN